MPTADAFATPALHDRFGRHVTYLRISVTDRCDFRCVYCMSDDMQFVPRARVLTLEELRSVAQAFTELGGRKIRITGGEPLVRKNILWLLREISRLPGLDELVLTTNGSQLERLAGRLQNAGVRRINISLDSLQPDRFRRMTRTGRLAQVLRGIEAARAAGFERIKLNTVVLKHYNHDEILDLVDFALARDLDISFIEEMPLGRIQDHDRQLAYCSSDEVRNIIGQQYELIETADDSGGPARYYRIGNQASRIGFISPHSHNFCDSCNRIRLTTEGRLLLCLGQEHSVDLRHILRANPGDLDKLKQALVAAIDIKPRGHDFDLGSQRVLFRHMNATGG